MTEEEEEALKAELEAAKSLNPSGKNLNEVPEEKPDEKA